PELIPHLFENSRFFKFRIGVQELEEVVSSDEPISYARLVSGIFDAYGEANRKALVGDKTPDYVRKIHTLHALWPSVKFIHLIRDGRDVCLSLLNWKRKAAKFADRFPTWVADPVTTAAEFWEWHVRLGREGGRELKPELYYEIRYEALVAGPEQECAKLCAFLDVPYEPEMLRFHDGRARAAPGLDAKNAWQPITAGLRDWPTQMARPDLEHFEAAAGGLLDELGYPRAIPGLSSTAGEQVKGVCDSVVQSLRAGKHLAPRSRCLPWRKYLPIRSSSSWAVPARERRSCSVCSTPTHWSPSRRRRIGFPGGTRRRARESRLREWSPGSWCGNCS